MPNESSQIVQRLWNYCNVLRDDGISYGDYVEQLTYLLFLKMADEQTKPPLSEQQKFAALVEKIESLCAKQWESENLFNSLMQRAFRGELVR